MSQNATEQTSGVQSVFAVFLSVLKHCDTVNTRKNKQRRKKKTYSLYLRSDLSDLNQTPS